MNQPRFNAAEQIKLPDTSESIRISPMALLKMLKHCKLSYYLENILIY
jgi:hypothetical protein